MILLARVGQLDLLRHSADNVWLPPAVYREVVEDAPEAPGAETVKNARWLGRKQPDPAAVRPLTLLVDAGEAEALALAQQIPEALLLLDDRRARQVAQSLAIPHIGTLGLLIHARKVGAIPRLRPLLEALIERGCRLSDSLFRRALARVGEDVE